MWLFFFFSSRRRHTRCLSDWSSDVCSSDLVGKIGIPDAVWLKPGALTDQERKMLEQHTEIGGRILSGSRSPILRLAEQIACTHHERFDGSGYPHQMQGDAIPLA